MARLVYQDWIVELSRDPSGHFPVAAEPGRSEAAGIIEAVSAALDRLPETEQEFIRRFYFMGESYRLLSEATGQPIYRLEKIQIRAFRHLEQLLGPWVRARFGLETGRQNRCPLCTAHNRDEIDRRIAAKPAHLTWRPLIRFLRTHLGITILTPQTLITHACYHLPAGDTAGPDGEEM